MIKILSRLKGIIKKICGIWRINENLAKLNDQMDSIYYIINNGMDIKTFPKATGILREIQLADTELLRIFHEVCEKYQLKYWLDWGTLLGAVRHGGFIPWDDDVDVSMPREDFIKAKSVFPVEFSKYDIKYGENEIQFIFVDGIRIGIDIFAMDNVSKTIIKNEKELSSRILNYVDFLRNNKIKNDYSRKRNEIIGVPDINNPIFYRMQEFWPSKDKTYSYEYDEIFPLKQIPFDDYRFYVPNNCDIYLKKIYGNYMQYPKSGILHHTENETYIQQEDPNSNNYVNEVFYRLKNISIEK